MADLLQSHGIITATPVQQKIIPAIRESRDILAQSETGSGKTLSFAIPIIEQLLSNKDLFSLILVPTRELCNQIHKEFVKFSPKKPNIITAVYGGVSISDQIKKLKHTNIIVATPGRLVDLIKRRAVNLTKIKYLVFDEADRMLDMGFIDDIEFILKAVPFKPQTMLFSATISDDIKRLSSKFLDNPFKVKLESKVKPEFLNQVYYQTTHDKKIHMLVHLLKSERDLTIVFCNTKRTADKLSKMLNDLGLRSKALHGNLTQAQRERVTADFRSKRFKILIATDVAARGLHIEDISHVYNYDIPKDVDSYTHRVGRTARAGNKGIAVSIVCDGEDKRFFKHILFNYDGVIQLKKAEFPMLDIRRSAPIVKKEANINSDKNKKSWAFNRGQQDKQRTGKPRNKENDFADSEDKIHSYPRRKGRAEREKFRRRSKAWRNY